MNLFYDLLFAKVPSWRQIQDIITTFGFVVGLLAGMSVKILHVFHHDDADVVRNRDWIGSYGRYQFNSHAAFILISCALFQLVLSYFFAMSTSFRLNWQRLPELEVFKGKETSKELLLDTRDCQKYEQKLRRQINKHLSQLHGQEVQKYLETLQASWQTAHHPIIRDTIDAWWGVSKVAIFLIFFCLGGGVICLFVSTEQVFILQHARTEDEAQALQSFTFLVNALCVIFAGLVIPASLLSFGLCLEREEKRKGANLNDESEQNEQSEETTKTVSLTDKTNALFSVPIVNLFYDLLFDVPPTLTQVGQMLNMLGLMNSLLLAVSLHMLNIFSPHEVDVVRERNFIGTYEQFKVSAVFAAACNVSALMQNVLTFLIIRASNEMEMEGRKKWWSLQRWNVMNMGLFTVAGCTFLFYTSTRIYILQHAETKQEAEDTQAGECDETKSCNSNSSHSDNDNFSNLDFQKKLVRKVMTNMTVIIVVIAVTVKLCSEQCIESASRRACMVMS